MTVMYFLSFLKLRFCCLHIFCIFNCAADLFNSAFCLGWDSFCCPISRHYRRISCLISWLSDLQQQSSVRLTWVCCLQLYCLIFCWPLLVALACQGRRSRRQRALDSDSNENITYGASSYLPQYLANTPGGAGCPAICCSPPRVDLVPFLEKKKCWKTARGWANESLWESKSASEWVSESAS